MLRFLICYGRLNSLTVSVGMLCVYFTIFECILYFYCTQTPLGYAIEDKLIEMVKLLLKFNADVNMKFVCFLFFLFFKFGYILSYIYYSYFLRKYVLFYLLFLFYLYVFCLFFQFVRKFINYIHSVSHMCFFFVLGVYLQMN